MADITDDLAELRKWLDKATPGPWKATDNSWETSAVYGTKGTVAECPIDAYVTEETQIDLEPIKIANARHIAACSPDRIRRVVDECEWLQRENEVLASERDCARARMDRSTQILVGIHSLLHPPRMTLDDGRVMEFRNPDANATLQALSDRIRAIPDEIAAMQEQTR